MLIGMAFEPYKAEILADQRYASLETKLLAIGGNHLVYSPTDLLDDIVLDGFLFELTHVGVVQGTQSGCHENSLKIVKAFPGECQLAHGFALSDDGLWRNHSWVMRGSAWLKPRYHD
jgi:hypothetical protein